MKNNSIVLLTIDLFDFVIPSDQHIAIFENIAITCRFSTCVPSLGAIFVQYSRKIWTSNKKGMSDLIFGMGQTSTANEDCQNTIHHH